jgi:hypothetical protein
MFSIKRISEFQSTIYENVNQLCEKIQQYQDDGRVLPLHRAMMALTTDVIFQYAFAKSPNQLESPNFEDTFHEALITVYATGQFALHFPIVFPILDLLPDWFVLRAQPVLQPVVGIRKVGTGAASRLKLLLTMRRILPKKSERFAMVSMKATRRLHM